MENDLSDRIINPLGCRKINRKGNFVLFDGKKSFHFVIQSSSDRSVWLHEYLRGASLEMYTETLSNYFVHDLKNFSEAARLEEDEDMKECLRNGLFCLDFA